MILCDFSKPTYAAKQLKRSIKYYDPENLGQTHKNKNIASFKKSKISF